MALGPDQHLVLIGLMGTGKTTVGRRVAALLDRPFVDNDVELERRAGRTARDVAAQDGVEALHRMEADALGVVLARRPGAVVASPASVVELADVDARLAPHVVVWLDADPAAVARRIDGLDHRPLPEHDRVRQLAAMDRERRSTYARLADVTVHEGDDRPDELARRVVAAVAAH